MRVSVYISHAEVKGFADACEVVITKVGKNTRKGTLEACKEVAEMSLAEVPQDTGTLASSLFYDVAGYYKTGWTGIIGYGGNGDPVNPKTGLPASAYMVTVHEDLTAVHPNGKAKYLEDPMREYAKERFPRTVFKYLPEALE